MDEMSGCKPPRGEHIRPRNEFTGTNRQNRRWISVADVAEMLSVTRREVYYMIEVGDLPGVRIGRAVRIPCDALELWIADKEAEAKESRSAYGPNARLD